MTPRCKQHANSLRASTDPRRRKQHQNPAEVAAPQKQAKAICPAVNKRQAVATAPSTLHHVSGPLDVLAPFCKEHCTAPSFARFEGACASTASRLLSATQTCTGKTPAGRHAIISAASPALGSQRSDVLNALRNTQPLKHTAHINLLHYLIALHLCTQLVTQPQAPGVERQKLGTAQAAQGHHAHVRSAALHLKARGPLKGAGRGSAQDV